jgi:hypothetical protein
MSWMRGAVGALLCALFVVTSLFAGPARAGTLEGQVKDDRTGEVIIGANIRVMGTNLGGTTDLDGKYAIAGLPAGTYSVRIFYGGYAAKVVTGVVVEEEGDARIDIKLEPLGDDQGEGATRLEDTYVTAERVRSTYASILSERQKSAVIGDAISADQIARSPDATSGDALKRVTGLSIVDNKFVYVRGVTDRYNTTQLNGVAVTSTDTDVDKKSFSFDLVPASLLANTVVIKSATPNLPGDFSGGLVQLNTLDFPSRRVVAAKVGVGGNEIATGKEKLLAATGSRDWLGKDDGTRARPGGVEGNELAKALPNNWAMGTENTPVNGELGFALGDRFGLGDEREVGYVGSLIYKAGYETEEYEQDPAPYFNARTENGVRYKSRVLWGGLFNLNFKPWRSHKLSFRNNYNRSAEEKLARAEGDLRGEGKTEPEQEQTIEWDERWLYLGQFDGEHEWEGLGNFGLEWQAHYNESEAKEPDRKIVRYAPDGRGNMLMRENHRSWSELAETGRGLRVDATQPFGDVKIRAGYLQSKRERDFFIEDWTTVGPTNRRKLAMLALPIEEIFAPENYGGDEFQFEGSSDFTGEYDASHDLSAYYGMLDLPFALAGQHMRITGGARVEDSDQVVNSLPDKSATEPVVAQVDETDVLPSVNFTYRMTGNANIRLGAYKSVNRPEFREMAPVKYFDYDDERNVIGNPNLDRAEITNYDVRTEWFPDIGEVISGSFFYKRFTNAIEEELIPAPDRYVQTWFNSDKAVNWGFELEARKSLGILWDYMDNFIAGVNYTWVESKVDYEDSRTIDNDGNTVTETRQRPMQGQAPWLLNLSLMYTEPTIGFNINFLFNKFGRRLDSVGETRDEDVYEESRGVLDVAITQQITDWSKLKFSARDITAEDEVYTVGNGTALHERRNAGTSYSITLSFNL